MDTHTKAHIMERAKHYLNSGWHCSEGILMAVGARYLDEVSPEALRLSTVFAGGVGGTNEELCGALAGGMMVISALYGRADAEANDESCMDLAVEFRARFFAHFGYTRCADLKQRWVGKKGQEDCAELVAQVAGLLVDVLEGEKAS